MINRHLAISVALATAFSNPLLPRQRTAEAPNRGQARRTHVSAAAVACLLRRPGPGQVPAQRRALSCSVPGGDEIRSRPALRQRLHQSAGAAGTEGNRVKAAGK
jgi:hypothetical protein